MLANDTDVDSATVSVTGYTQPVHGTVVVNADGSFTYNPAAHYAGEDSFTYQAADPDGATSEPATVAITVNAAPIVSAVVGSPESGTGKVTVTLTASDPEGGPLTVTSTAPSQGDVGIVENADGSWTLTFTPADTARHAASADDAEATGANKDTFDVTVTDGQGGSTTVPVSVAISPTNADPGGGTPTVNPGFGPLGQVSGTITDVIDPEGDPLSYNGATTGKGSAVAYPNGTFTYTPNVFARHAASADDAAATGADRDTFNVAITDGHGGTTSVTVTVPISPINTAPVGGTVVLNPGFGPLGQVTGMVTNITDPNGDLLAFAGANTAKGTATVYPNGALVYSPTADARHAASANDAAATGADRDTFNVTVTDGHGGTTTVPVTVPISATNNPPTTMGPTIGTPDSAGVVTGSLKVADPEVDPLVYTVTNAPTKGQVSIDQSTGIYTYTPSVEARHAAAADGATLADKQDTFTVAVSDGHGGTLPITVASVPVSPANAAPVATSAPTIGIPNSVGRVTGSLKVTDTDTDPLIYTVTGTPTQGRVTIDQATGVYAYTPFDAARLAAYNTPASETDTFIVSVNDGHGGSTQVTVAAIPVALAKASVTATVPGSSGAYGVAATPDGTRAYVTNSGDGTVEVIDTDPDSATFNTVIGRISVGTLPSMVTVSPDGTRAYVSTANGPGSVAVIDTGPLSPTYNTVIANVALGSPSYGIAVTPDGTRAYVAQFDFSVSVIDTNPQSAHCNTVIGSVGIPGANTRPRGVTITPDGTRAYVTLSEANSVVVIDTVPTSPAYNTVIGTVGVGPARGVTLSPDGMRGYVTGGNRVSVIDTDPTSASYNTVIDTVTVGANSFGAAVSPDGSLVYVTNANGNSVSLIDTRSNDVIATIPVGTSPFGVAVSPGGAAYIANNGGTAVSVISVVPMANASPVANATVSSPNAAGKVTVTLTASDPDGDPLIVTNTAPSQGSVVVVDNHNGTFTYTYTAHDDARLKAYITPGIETDSFSVTVSDGHGGSATIPVGAVPISPAQLAVTASVPVTTYPTGVAVSPTGSFAYVTNQGGTVTVINTVGNTFVTSIALSGSTANTAAVAFTPDGTKAFVTHEGWNGISVIRTVDNWVTTIPLASPAYGVAVASTPSGTRAYVTSPGTNEVLVIDTGTNAVIANIAVGSVPLGVTVSPDGTRVWVTNRGSNTVSVIDTATNQVATTTGTGAGSQPYGVAFSPDGKTVVIANSGANSVSVIDVVTNTVATVSVGRGPHSVIVSGDGTLIYVANYDDGTVSVIDTATKTVVNTLHVGSMPRGLAVGPSGIYVTDYGGVALRLISFVAMPIV